MQPLSAIDAISPAWDHTRKMLLEPMRWTTLFKIGLVAAFAGIGGGSSFNGSSGNTGGLPHTPIHIPSLAFALPIILFAGVFLFILWLAFFYLSSRLQFVLFDVVLRRDTTIGPIWSRFGAATWRWMALRLLFLLGAIAISLPLLVPAILSLIHAIPKDRDTDLATLIGPFFAVFGILALLAILVGIGELLLHDFGLPSMALESTSLSETVLRVFRFLRAEPLQLCLYLVMKFIVALVAGIAIGIAFGIGALVLLIPFGGVGGIMYAMLHHGDLPLRITMWFFIALLAIGYAAVMMVAIFMSAGVFGTFFQAYALYFLGGYYPLLGDALQPTPVAPPGYYYPPMPAQPTPPGSTSW